MNTGQGIRPSQFILTYGVGSIIEAPGGPRVIPAFSEWGNNLTATLNKPSFTIYERSASKLLGGAKIFKIPTNSSINNMTDSGILFTTFRFPMWALCVTHKKLYQLDTQDQTRCTECARGSSPIKNKKTWRDEAIRFVRACPDGHMDDIDWKYVIHQGSVCDNMVFEWDGGHSTLEDVSIGCTECGAKISLKDVYNRTSACSGYIPEKKEHVESCDKDMKVMLRSQSSLRIPKLITVITIPPYDSNAYFILSDASIKILLAQKKPEEWERGELVKSLEAVHGNSPELISRDQLDRIKEIADDELADAISRNSNSDEGQISVEDVMRSEFKALKNGAEYGAPPITSKGRTQFEMNLQSVREVSIASGTLRIAPVQRLRAIIVQQGYTRTSTDTSKASLVETYLRKDRAVWYPGIELLGEGLFLDFKDDHAISFGKEHEQWLTKFSSDPQKNKKFHPMFVWWHTFSHAIINMLSIDSGYSAASIRERVYFDCDADGENPRGGVLLYTSQPSGDGTLGGLLAMADDFQRRIIHIRERMRNCSNDPLCSSGHPEQDRNNGSVCYACLMLSETSCENMNSMLDRNLMGDTV